jgi:HK97 family phage major capsid protein
MDNLELQLAELKQGLEAALEKKSVENITVKIAEFESKAKGLFADEIKSVKEALEAKLEESQKHIDALDVKLKASKTEKKVTTANELIVKHIEENFHELKEVRVGKSSKIEVKAVGDMSLSVNLTGAQPKDYNFDVVMIPNQKVNVSDLVGVVNISGGTYTFPRETGGEGSIGAQTEGSTKNQKDYDLAMIDVNTDFIAGFTRYSKKMANNLPFLTSFVPNALRRDYAKAENASFQAVLAATATASTETITGAVTKEKMLINEIGKLEDADYNINGIVVRPTDYLSILKLAKDDLAAATTYEGGVLRVAGVQLFKATWLPANKYYVGDWSRVNKIVTEGLSLEFSEQEGTNFVKNQITARIEAQVALAVEQPLALVYGDFTATA